MSKKQSPDEIVSALFTAFTQLKNRMGFSGALYQLPLAQIETLRLIGESKQILMKEVANFLAITPPSATVLIDNLQKAGYVQRLTDKHDRRAIHLSLTKKGSAVLQKSIQQRCKDLQKMLSNLSQRDKL